MKGFTLIEVLISLFIIFLIFGLAVFSYSNFRIKSSLDSTAQEIIVNLRIARSKTLASESSSSYGIHFDSASYTLFPGSVYDPNNNLNKVFSLPSFLEIINVDLVGFPDVIFERVTGRTNNFGSVKARQAGGGEERTVKIDNSGNTYISTISYAETGARLNDSRHLHFDYSRTINLSPSETIDLYFDGSGVPQTQINISNGLDVNSHFNYEGTTLVGGENQTIKIHTHILNSGSTPTNQFSIFRDRSKNTKSLIIKISGDAGSLVSYTAAGVETLGNSIWASNLSRQ